MTVHVLKYSQVVWAYFILDVATIAIGVKLIDVPRRGGADAGYDGYQVEEESSDLRSVYRPLNLTASLDQTVLPSKLGLFVSQPPSVANTESPGPESRYGLVFGGPPPAFSPLTKKRRGVLHADGGGGLSLFTKVDEKNNRPKDLFEKYRQSEYTNKRPVLLGSDRYLTPQFVKFKNEIEKETERTHLRGMKMTKDAAHAPTVVYESPSYKQQQRHKSKKSGYHRFVDNSPIPSTDEGYRSSGRPYHHHYDEPPESYDKPTSYQRYSSSTPSEPYLPPNFDTSDITFPPYPPYPSSSVGESEPFHAPRSESEARSPPYTFPSTYEFPSSSSYRGGSGGGGSGSSILDDLPYPFPKSSKFPRNEEEDESENEYSPEDYPPLPTRKPSRKLVDAADDEYGRRPDTDADDLIRPNTKWKRRRNRWGRPYGEPSEVPLSVSRNNHNNHHQHQQHAADDNEDDDEFDANFESPSTDTFASVDDEDKESEEEEEAAPAPKGRLRLSSRQQPRRVPPGRKRCVKKRKEMSMDDLDDEPGRQMTCLVCESLETGGTYETCSYESEPKKNSYFQGNAASYRKGSSSAARSPNKYRFKRDTTTAGNNGNDGSSKSGKSSNSSNSSSSNDNPTNRIESTSSSSTVRVVRDTKKSGGTKPVVIGGSGSGSSSSSDDDDSAGSYSADPADFGPENFAVYDNEDDDDHEDLQDDIDDSDDLDEFKPQPPAYANEHSCKEIIRGDATCMVCRNPETNGKYEQCSYANDPDDAYEYAQSSSYGRKNKSSPKHRSRRSKTAAMAASSTVTPVVGNVTASPSSSSTSALQSNATSAAVASPLAANATKTTLAAANKTELAAAKLPAEWRVLRDIEQRKIARVNDIFKTLVRTKREQPNSRFLADLEDGSYEKQFLNLFPELGSDSSASTGFEADESMLKELSTKPLFGKASEPLPGFKSKAKMAGYFKGFPKKSRFLEEDDDGGDSEMTKMMREFASKDRSACTKKMKDKMTCYVCGDKDGMKREECMYVVENEPKKASFHELKNADDGGAASNTAAAATSTSGKTSSKREAKYKFVPPGEMLPASSQTVVHQTIEARKYGNTPIVASPNTYSNVQIRTEKTYSLRGVPNAAAATAIDDRQQQQQQQQQQQEQQRRRRRRRHRLSFDPEADGSTHGRRFKRGRGGRAEDRRDGAVAVEDPEENGEYTAVEVVPEADPGSPDGAFSDDTEVVYDAELKTSLPKFMVEKSEHEAIVDEFISRL